MLQKSHQPHMNQHRDGPPTIVMSRIHRRDAKLAGERRLLDGASANLILMPPKYCPPIRRSKACMDTRRILVHKAYLLNPHL